ncbi:MAG: transcription antitermination factor NusB [Bacteroidales bacterium]|nr:transcription antitermination factor NusB [Bacteroidales bacterium]
MINRSLIRLKVIQLLYAYYQNGGKTVESMEKELLFSLAKAYDLYNYLLMLIVEVTKYGRQVVEHQEELNSIAHIDTVISHRFIDNQFACQLELNKQLIEFKEEKKLSWTDEDEYIRQLYETITGSKDYKTYMLEPETDYAQDRELWRRIYKSIIMTDERIDDILEAQSLYWNDDKQIVDTFVLKTIKHFDEANGADQELVPEFKDEEDREFAIRLLRRSLVNAEYYRSLIAQNIQNWEMNRLAFMDLLIMQMAIAEILSFPEIPVRISINEYLDIAGYYSTPKSPKYINGVLDHVCRRLQSEGKLLKQYK